MTGIKLNPTLTLDTNKYIDDEPAKHRHLITESGQNHISKNSCRVSYLQSIIEI